MWFDDTELSIVSDLSNTSNSFFAQIDLSTLAELSKITNNLLLDMIYVKYSTELSIMAELSSNPIVLDLIWQLVTG